MAWVKETGVPGQPGYSQQMAGEAAMSPSQAAALGYHWEGAGGTYGRAPTEAEYIGIIAEKQRTGQYVGQPAEKAVEAEIEKGRKEHGEKGPPWGTPEKWRPYIQYGVFKAPEVQILEQKWSPFISGEQFTGTQEQYQQYQQEAQKAYSIQEQKYQTYQLEEQLYAARAKQGYEINLRQYSERSAAATEYERGYNLSVHNELVKAQEQQALHQKIFFGLPYKYETLQSSISHSSLINPISIEMERLEHDLPTINKMLYPTGTPAMVKFSEERTIGQARGLTDKPLTAATWFGVSLAATLIVPEIGAVARSAEGAFPVAAPLIARIAPKGIGYGMTAGYAASVGTRLYQTPPGERARAFGMIETTELMPMAAGYAVGAKLLKIPEAVPYRAHYGRPPEQLLIEMGKVPVAPAKAVTTEAVAIRPPEGIKPEGYATFISKPTETVVGKTPEIFKTMTENVSPGGYAKHLIESGKLKGVYSPRKLPGDIYPSSEYQAAWGKGEIAGILHHHDIYGASEQSIFVNPRSYINIPLRKAYSFVYQRPPSDYLTFKHPLPEEILAHELYHFKYPSMSELEVLALEQKFTYSQTKNLFDITKTVKIGGGEPITADMSTVYVRPPQQATSGILQRFSFAGKPSYVTTPYGSYLKVGMPGVIPEGEQTAISGLVMPKASSGSKLWISKTLDVAPAKMRVRPVQPHVAIPEYTPDVTARMAAPVGRSWEAPRAPFTGIDLAYPYMEPVLSGAASLSFPVTEPPVTWGAISGFFSPPQAPQYPISDLFIGLPAKPPLMEIPTGEIGTPLPARAPTVTLPKRPVITMVRRPAVFPYKIKVAPIPLLPVEGKLPARGGAVSTVMTMPTLNKDTNRFQVNIKAQAEQSSGKGGFKPFFNLPPRHKISFQPYTTAAAPERNRRTYPLMFPSSGSLQVPQRPSIGLRIMPVPTPQPTTSVRPAPFEVTAPQPVPQPVPRIDIGPAPGPNPPRFPDIHIPVPPIPPPPPPVVFAYGDDKERKKKRKGKKKQWEWLEMYSVPTPKQLMKGPIMAGAGIPKLSMAQHLKKYG
jgi:hypothetical protein